MKKLQDGWEQSAGTPLRELQQESLEIGESLDDDDEGIKIIIPGIPVSGSQLKFNRTTGSAYRPKEHKQRVFEVSEYCERAAEEKLNIETNEKLSVDDLYKHLPLYKKGIFMEFKCTFYFPYRSQDYGTGRNEGVLKPNAPSWVIGQKDLDNLLKPLKDGLKGVIINDDKQIVRYYSIEKKYSESPRTEIHLRRIM